MKFKVIVPNRVVFSESRQLMVCLKNQHTIFFVYTKTSLISCALQTLRQYFIGNFAKIDVFWIHSAISHSTDPAYRVRCTSCCLLNLLPWLS